MKNRYRRNLLFPEFSGFPVTHHHQTRSSHSGAFFLSSAFEGNPLDLNDVRIHVLPFFVKHTLMLTPPFLGGGMTDVRIHV